MSSPLPRDSRCDCQLERKLGIAGDEVLVAPVPVMSAGLVNRGEPVNPAFGVLPAAFAEANPCSGSDRTPTPISILAATLMDWILAANVPTSREPS
jgi:hypothetical protein